HLAGALFEQIAGVKMTHVPYRVTSQLQTDLVAGEVPVSFQLLPNVISALKAGQVRPLAVANATRLPALPEVPTSAELGLKGYESSAWFGLVAPRGTPRPVVDRLNAEVASAMRDATVRARFVESGVGAGGHVAQARRKLRGFVVGERGDARLHVGGIDAVGLELRAHVAPLEERGDALARGALAGERALGRQHAGLRGHAGGGDGNDQGGGEETAELAHGGSFLMDVGAAKATSVHITSQPRLRPAAPKC